MYILTNNQGDYICRGKDQRLFLSKDNRKALRLETETKAQNLINNLPKKLKGKDYKIEKIGFKKSLTNAMSNFNDSDFITSIKTSLNSLSNLADFDETVCSYKEKMLKELSTIDLELTDLDHFIESHKFSASEGYKISHMRQERLKKRRIIKNNIRMCDLLKQCTSDSVKSCKKIEQIENYSYTPRVLKDLFENRKLD
jgi:hypothetical protein